jgi:hypothetical protein
MILQGRRVGAADTRDDRNDACDTGYNCPAPGVLKYAIDRGIALCGYNACEGKPAAIMGASAGNRPARFVFGREKTKGG